MAANDIDNVLTMGTLHDELMKLSRIERESKALEALLKRSPLEPLASASVVVATWVFLNFEYEQISHAIRKLYDLPWIEGNVPVFFESSQKAQPAFDARLKRNTVKLSADIMEARLLVVGTGKEEMVGKYCETSIANILQGRSIGTKRLANSSAWKRLDMLFLPEYADLQAGLSQFTFWQIPSLETAAYHSLQCLCTIARQEDPAIDNAIAWICLHDYKSRTVSLSKEEVRLVVATSKEILPQKWGMWFVDMVWNDRKFHKAAQKLVGVQIRARQNALNEWGFETKKWKDLLDLLQFVSGVQRHWYMQFVYNTADFQRRMAVTVQLCFADKDLLTRGHMAVAMPWLALELFPSPPVAVTGLTIEQVQEVLVVAAVVRAHSRQFSGIEPETGRYSHHLWMVLTEFSNRWILPGEVDKHVRDMVRRGFGARSRAEVLPLCEFVKVLDERFPLTSLYDPIKVGRMVPGEHLVLRATWNNIGRVINTAVDADGIAPKYVYAVELDAMGSHERNGNFAMDVTTNTVSYSKKLPNLTLEKCVERRTLCETEQQNVTAQKQAAMELVADYKKFSYLDVDLDPIQKALDATGPALRLIADHEITLTPPAVAVDPTITQKAIGQVTTAAVQQLVIPPTLDEAATIRGGIVDQSTVAQSLEVLQAKAKDDIETKEEEAKTADKTEKARRGKAKGDAEAFVAREGLKLGTAIATTTTTKRNAAEARKDAEEKKKKEIELKNKKAALQSKAKTARDEATAAAAKIPPPPARGASNSSPAPGFLTNLVKNFRGNPKKKPSLASEAAATAIAEAERARKEEADRIAAENVARTAHEEAERLEREAAEAAEAAETARLATIHAAEAAAETSRLQLEAEAAQKAEEDLAREIERQRREREAAEQQLQQVAQAEKTRRTRELNALKTEYATTTRTIREHKQAASTETYTAEEIAGFQADAEELRKSIEELQTKAHAGVYRMAEHFELERLLDQNSYLGRKVYIYAGSAGELVKYPQVEALVEYLETTHEAAFRRHQDALRLPTSVTDEEKADLEFYLDNDRKIMNMAIQFQCNTPEATADATQDMVDIARDVLVKEEKTYHSVIPKLPLDAGERDALLVDVQERIKMQMDMLLAIEYRLPDLEKDYTSLVKALNEVPMEDIPSTKTYAIALREVAKAFPLAASTEEAEAEIRAHMKQHVKMWANMTFLGLITNSSTAPNPVLQILRGMRDEYAHDYILLGLFLDPPEFTNNQWATGGLTSPKPAAPVIEEIYAKRLWFLRELYGPGKRAEVEMAIANCRQYVAAHGLNREEREVLNQATKKPLTVADSSTLLRDMKEIERLYLSSTADKELTLPCQEDICDFYSSLGINVTGGYTKLHEFCDLLMQLEHISVSDDQTALVVELETAFSHLQPADRVNYKKRKAAACGRQVKLRKEQFEAIIGAVEKAIADELFACVTELKLAQDAFEKLPDELKKDFRDRMNTAKAGEQRFLIGGLDTLLDQFSDDATPEEWGKTLDCIDGIIRMLSLGDQTTYVERRTGRLTGKLDTLLDQFSVNSTPEIRKGILRCADDIFGRLPPEDQKKHTERKTTIHQVQEIMMDQEVRRSTWRKERGNQLLPPQRLAESEATQCNKYTKKMRELAASLPSEHTPRDWDGEMFGGIRTVNALIATTYLGDLPPSEWKHYEEHREREEKGWVRDKEEGERAQTFAGADVLQEFKASRRWLISPVTDIFALLDGIVAFCKRSPDEGRQKRDFLLSLQLNDHAATFKTLWGVERLVIDGTDKKISDVVNVLRQLEEGFARKYNEVRVMLPEEHMIVSDDMPATSIVCDAMEKALQLGEELLHTTHRYFEPNVEGASATTWKARLKDIKDRTDTYRISKWCLMRDWAKALAADVNDEDAKTFNAVEAGKWLADLRLSSYIEWDWKQAKLYKSLIMTTSEPQQSFRNTVYDVLAENIARRPVVYDDPAIYNTTEACVKYADELLLKGLLTGDEINKRLPLSKQGDFACLYEHDKERYLLQNRTVREKLATWARKGRECYREWVGENSAEVVDNRLLAYVKILPFSDCHIRYVDNLLVIGYGRCPKALAELQLRHQTRTEELEALAVEYAADGPDPNPDVLIETIVERLVAKQANIELALKYYDKDYRLHDKDRIELETTLANFQEFIIPVANTIALNFTKIKNGTMTLAFKNVSVEYQAAKLLKTKLKDTKKASNPTGGVRAVLDWLPGGVLLYLKQLDSKVRHKCEMKRITDFTLPINFGGRSTDIESTVSDSSAAPSGAIFQLLPPSEITRSIHETNPLPNDRVLDRQRCERALTLSHTEGTEMDRFLWDVGVRYLSDSSRAEGIFAEEVAWFWDIMVKVHEHIPSFSREDMLPLKQLLQLARWQCEMPTV